MSTESAAEGGLDHDDPVVLVVDDEANVAEAYGLWLPDNYEVRTATNGEQALDQADEDVDVVLLDRHMPDLSGDEVLERLRERGLDCRVAMVTAVDPDFDIAEMPFDTYLTKPVDQAEIQDTVENLLGLSSFGDQSRQFFAVSRKIAALEDEKRASQLEDSDTYQQLVQRREELDSELDDAVGEMDDDDLEAAFRDL
ncbi:MULTISPECIES: response regulator [Halobacterium]|uniref:response regulator n=1 Tax=Halobacterium TaxID=2239 RepID=UPI00073EB0FD|nr:MULTISPECIES: response regulator [Halobacterium]MCG1003383.1 response regulator [Halobacterium noricense]